MRTLFVDGNVYSLTENFATALLVEDATVAWIGAEGGALVHRADADEIVVLDGDLLAPGFVHLAASTPPAGFVHAEIGTVEVADDWTDEQWDEAQQRPLAVVPRGNCRLRSRISAGTPTALVPEPGQSGWKCLRAAVHEIGPDERISARAAFSALTRSAWRLLGHPEAGVIAVDAPATFVRWAVTDLVVETPDERISNWSTDPRAATPGLPALQPGGPVPDVRQVWLAGHLQ